MALLLILPLLVSGYIVCLGHPYYLSKLHGYDGQSLYFLVAKLGMACVFFSFILCGAALYATEYFGWIDYQSWFERELMDLGFADKPHAASYAFMAQVGVVSMFIPWPWNRVGALVGWGLGKFSNVGNSRLYYLSKNMLEDQLEKVILASFFAQKQMVYFQMSDRQAYIGHVLDLSEPRERASPHSTFSFVPKYSGYIDDDTRKLKITTEYVEADGFSIVLRSENIVQAALWDYANPEDFTRLQTPDPHAHKSLRKRLG